MVNRDYGPFCATVNSRNGRAPGTCQGDGFALEVDVLGVRSGCNQYRIAGTRGVDGGLNSGLVGRHMDRALGG